MDIVHEYLLNTQFHGLRYLVESGRHWIERIFWLICICASWGFCYVLVLYSWRNFQNNSLSFGADTDYINWNTSFFSVSVCEFRNKDKVYEKGDQLTGDKDRNYNLDEALTDIAYFRGDHYFLKSFCQGSDTHNLCPKEGLTEFSEEVRSNCSEIFKLCTWNEVPFDCCHYFHRLETERGPCYTINSMQTKNQTKLPLISNKITGPGSLYLELTVQSAVHIQSAEDVPNYNAVSAEHLLAKKNIQVKRIHRITDIVNSEQVRNVAVEKRRCRFPEENIIPNYRYYSYSACLLDCRVKKQISLCNCTSHLTPGVATNEKCNLDGLLCLLEHYQSYSVLINSWSDRDGLKCNCLPSCTEPEYDLVVEFENGIDTGEGLAIVELALQKLPVLRLKRTVVRDTLDLVVSMGGAVGLFVGASLLSFVELFYFFTIHFAWTRFNRSKQQERKRSQQDLKNIPFTQNYPYLS